MPFGPTIAGSRRPATSQVVIADNRFGTTTYPGSWLVAIAPQNVQEMEGVEDIVVENNVFVHGRNTQVDVAMRGRRITSRANRIEGGGGAQATRIQAEYPAEAARWDGPYVRD